MDKLTDKQELFCREYLKDLNATQAAIRAGYSFESAQQMGSENLSKPLISERISGLKEKRNKRLEITHDMIVSELIKIGFSNVQDYLNADESNAVTTLTDLKRSKTAAIESIQVDSTTFEGVTQSKVKLKLYNKLEALEKLAKHTGFFEKDNKQSAPVVSVVPEIRVYNSAPPMAGDESEIEDSKPSPSV